MFISLTLAGFAVLCIAPAILDAREDRRFRRDFQVEQHSRTQRALNIGSRVPLSRTTSPHGVQALTDE